MVSAEPLALASGGCCCFQMPHGKFISRLKINFRSSYGEVTLHAIISMLHVISLIFEYRKVHIRDLRRGSRKLYFSDERVLIGSLFFWHTLFSLAGFAFQVFTDFKKMGFVVYISDSSANVGLFPGTVEPSSYDCDQQDLELIATIFQRGRLSTVLRRIYDP